MTSSRHEHASGSRRGARSQARHRGATEKTRRVGPGSRLRRTRISGARRIRRNLLLGHRMGGGRVIYGLKGRRVRFLAVVPRREARKRATQRRLRTVRLLAR